MSEKKTATSSKSNTKAERKRGILIDTRQKPEKHTTKHNRFKQLGYQLISQVLPVGDYCFYNDKIADVFKRKKARGLAVKGSDLLGTYTIAVDTKQGLQEVYQNIVGKNHLRFVDECILATNNGIKLYVLVEDQKTKQLSDVHKWNNPRIAYYNRIKKMKAQGKAKNVHLGKSPPMSSQKLEDAMTAMQEKYGVTFVFATTEEAADTIIKLLEGGK